MEEISLLELLEALKKRIGIILLLTILGGGLAFGISQVLPNQYETFTTLLLGRPKDYESTQNNIQMDDILINQKLVGTYGELIKSRNVSEQVIKELGLDMDYETFRQKVNVNLVQDTEIIKIIVRDGNSLRAKDIANETAAVFEEAVVEAMNIENIRIIDYAIEPDKPIAPRPKLNAVIGMILGLMLGVFIALFREFTDNTVKNAEDIEKYLGLPVIGNIPLIEEGKKR